MYLGFKFLALETIVLLLNPGKEAPRRDVKNSILIWVLKFCFWYWTLSFAVRKTVVKEFLKFKIISARYGHLNRVTYFAVRDAFDGRRSRFPEEASSPNRLVPPDREFCALPGSVKEKKQIAARKAS